jgi:hypothetical protein
MGCNKSTNQIVKELISVQKLIQKVYNVHSGHHIAIIHACATV